MRMLTIIVFVFSITACGGGEDGSNNSENTLGVTSGLINLAGVDTAIVGTELNTGFIGSSLAADGQPDYIIIVDKNSSVTFTPPNTLIPSLGDSNNGFILVVTDDSAGLGFKGLSMSIFVGGTKLSYACTTPNGPFVDCGTDAISLNIANRTVTFNNAMLQNTDSSDILTLDGTLTWSGGGESTNSSSTNSSNSGGARTDITGLWKQDANGYFWISTRGEADEIYDLFNADGTYFTYAYFANEPCYDYSSGSYKDLGNGNISFDDYIPFNFSISDNTMTVSDSSKIVYTAEKVTLDESFFTPQCN